LIKNPNILDPDWATNEAIKSGTTNKSQKSFKLRRSCTFKIDSNIFPPVFIKVSVVFDRHLYHGFPDVVGKELGHLPSKKNIIIA
jgi:hypothetical protein